jgi:hypothetical protein
VRGYGCTSNAPTLVSHAHTVLALPRVVALVAARTGNTETRATAGAHLAQQYSPSVTPMAAHCAVKPDYLEASTVAIAVGFRPAVTASGSSGVNVPSASIVYCETLLSFSLAT